jgi:hypothetical protein
MTMDDDIQLPPLPALGLDTVRKAEQIFNYARVAVLADRERRAKQEAKPVVHSRTLDVHRDGAVVLNTLGVVPPGWTRLTLRWTADGRVWIESEQNRELAKRLRNRHVHARLDAADALDGGER